MTAKEIAEEMSVKPWAVKVIGYPEAGIYYTRTRGQAMADAWRCDAFGNITFKKFLSIANCRRAEAGDPDFGQPITVLGKPAFYVERNRAYVKFSYPGSDIVMSAHPSDVLPEKYRPSAYRTILETTVMTEQTEAPQWARRRIEQLRADSPRCSYRDAFADYIAKHETPPVDPDLEKARELLAVECENSICTTSPNRVRNGKCDDTPAIRAILAAIKWAREQ